MGQTDASKIKTYLQIINLIAGEIDRVVYYYIFNEHGDVAQLWSQSGTCKASYEYDSFEVERTWIWMMRIRSGIVGSILI